MAREEVQSPGFAHIKTETLLRRGWPVGWAVPGGTQWVSPAAAAVDPRRVGDLYGRPLTGFGHPDVPALQYYARPARLALGADPRPAHFPTKENWSQGNHPRKSNVSDALTNFLRINK